MHVLGATPKAVGKLAVGWHQTFAPNDVARIRCPESSVKANDLVPHELVDKPVKQANSAAK